MKRSSLLVLLLLAGAAWTAGQTVLPDLGLAWARRLDAIAADRGAEALSAALFVVAGALLVVAALTVARVAVAGRGARVVRAGTVLLGLGGIWLAAGRGAFNLHMYRMTDPAVDREAALAVASAETGVGFVALLPTLPALLLGPAVLAVGAWRTGLAGRLPAISLACWVLGIGVFLVTEFTVKAGEIAGVASASVGLVLLGAALMRVDAPRATAGAGAPGGSSAPRMAGRPGAAVATGRAG